jgi:hypothetical protein
VVAFVAGPRIMVHRVVYRGRSHAARGFLITHGDGNYLCDPPIRDDAIAGIVERHCAQRGWVTVEAARLTAAQRVVSAPSFWLLRSVLEVSPAAARSLARAMSYVRMSVRAIVPMRP